MSAESNARRPSGEAAENDQDSEKPSGTDRNRARFSTARVAAELFEQLERSNRRKELELATELRIASSLGSRVDPQQEEDNIESSAGDDSDESEFPQGPVAAGVGSTRVRPIVKKMQAQLPTAEQLGIKSSVTSRSGPLLSDLVNVKTVKPTANATSKKAVLNQYRALPKKDEDSDFEIEFSDLEDDVGPENRVASQKFYLPNAKRSLRTQAVIGGGHAAREKKVRFVGLSEFGLPMKHNRVDDDSDFHLSDGDEATVQGPVPNAGPTTNDSPIRAEDLTRSDEGMREEVPSLIMRSAKMVVPKPAAPNRKPAVSRATRQNVRTVVSAESPDPHPPRHKIHQSRRQFEHEANEFRAARDDDLDDELNRQVDLMFDPAEFVDGTTLEDSQISNEVHGLRAFAMGPPSASPSGSTDDGKPTARRNRPSSASGVRGNAEKYKIIDRSSSKVSQRPRSILKNVEQQKDDGAPSATTKDVPPTQPTQSLASEKKKTKTWKEKLRTNAIGGCIRQLGHRAIGCMIVACLLVFACGLASFIYGAVRFAVPNERGKVTDRFNEMITEAEERPRHRGGGNYMTDLDFLQSLLLGSSIQTNTDTSQTDARGNLTFAREKIELRGNLEGLADNPRSVLLQTMIPSANDYQVTLGLRSSPFHALIQDKLYFNNDVFPKQALEEPSEFENKFGVFYLSRVCLVIKQESAASYRLVRDSERQSCWYPFTHQKYSRSAPAAVTFQVRLTTDPLIFLEQHSQGTHAIGGETRHERDVGAGWSVAVGVVFMIPFLWLTFQLFLELWIRRQVRILDRKIVDGTVIISAGGKPRKVPKPSE